MRILDSVFKIICLTVVPLSKNGFDMRSGLVCLSTCRIEKHAKRFLKVYRELLLLQDIHVKNA
jgi:hypothetical protein